MTQTTMQLAPDPATDTPDYLTEDGPVWMHRRGQRTWFTDADGVQVGPTHRNLVPAVVYAGSCGWWDPSAPAWLNVGVILEVRAGGAKPQPGQRHSPRGYSELQPRGLDG